MCSEEGTYLANREGNPRRRLLPGEHAHLGVGREHRGFHCGAIWVRAAIIWQNQYGRLARTDEITSHGKDEVGIGSEHLGQECVGHLCRDFGLARD